MATRYYFPSTGAPDISPAFGSGWHDTASASRLKLITTKINSASAEKTFTSTAMSGEFHLGYQYVGPALAAQSLSGTVKGVVMAFENNAAFNGKVSLCVRVVDATGAHKIFLTNADTAQPVFSSTAASPPEVLLGTTPGNSRAFRHLDDDDDIVLADFTCADGDRIVVEIGLIDGDTSTTRQGTIRIGDNAGADIPMADGDTSDNDPWIEFTQDFDLQVLSSTTGSAAWQSAVVSVH